MTALADSAAAPTRAEQELRAAFSLGEPLDLTPGQSPGTGPLHDESRVIHARVIRELLLSDAVTPGRLRQVTITRADIRGPLDLRFMDITCPLRLTDCSFDSVVTLAEAHLRSLSLSGCHGRGIDARHVGVDGDLALDRVRLTGPLRLAGAHLKDDLHLVGAHIDARGSTPALELDNIDVAGKIDAQRLTVDGKVSMRDASVTGSLRIAGARIHAGPGLTAWYGDGLKVGGELDASGLQATGQVRLVDARILSLVLQGAHITNSRHTLILDRLESRGSVFCDGESRFDGGIHAIGIQVGATVYLDHAQVRAAPGKTGAVSLCNATLTGDLLCDEGFRAVGHVDLTGAHIGGQVLLRKADLRAADGNKETRAFTADRAQIGGDLSCLYGSCLGTMSLVRARIGGEMDVFREKDGFQAESALVAPGLCVSRDVNLRTGGTVDLSGAEVTGDINLDLAPLDSGGGPAAADLSGASADVLTLVGSPKHGSLDLTRTSVRLLLDNPQTRPADSPVVLDGLEYDAIATTEETKNPRSYRLDWLKAGTQRVRRSAGEYDDVRFRPQPYTQLAQAYRRAGDDREARRILYRMYREQNSRMTSWRRPHSKVWNGAQDLFLGYGYVPSRALITLLVLAGIASAWFLHSDPAHIGLFEAAILSLGMVLPGSGFDRIEQWTQMSGWSHLLAAGLVMGGLLLGATVIAALARIIKS
jgi:hypothetical protein